MKQQLYAAHSLVFASLDTIAVVFVRPNRTIARDGCAATTSDASDKAH